MKQRKNSRSNPAYIDHYNNVIYPRRRPQRNTNDFHERNCRSYEEYVPSYERVGYIYDDRDPYEQNDYHDMFEMSREDKREKMYHDYHDPTCLPLYDERYQRNLYNYKHCIDHNTNLENREYATRQPSCSYQDFVGNSRHSMFDVNDRINLEDREYVKRRLSRGNEDVMVISQDTMYDINDKTNLDREYANRRPSRGNDDFLWVSQNNMFDVNDRTYLEDREYTHRRPSRGNDDFMRIIQNPITQRKNIDRFPLRRSQSLESFNRFGRKGAKRDTDTQTRWTDSTISTKRSLRSLFRHKEVMDNVKRKNSLYKSSIRPRKLFRDKPKTNLITSKSLSAKGSQYDESARTGVPAPISPYSDRAAFLQKGKYGSFSDELDPSLQTEFETPKRTTWFEDQTNKMKLALWQTPLMSKHIQQSFTNDDADPNIPKIIETKQESISSKEKNNEQWKLPDFCCFEEKEHNYLFAANACCFTITLLVLFS